MSTAMARPCECRFVCERPGDCPRVEWADPESTPAADVRAFLDRIERKVVSDAEGPCRARWIPARGHAWTTLIGAGFWWCRHCGERKS